MRFRKNVPEEVREYLEQELKEYIEIKPMTPTERGQLRSWVSQGNSVHRNGCYIHDESGIEMDFVDAERFLEDLENERMEQCCKRIAAERERLDIKPWESDPELPDDLTEWSYEVTSDLGFCDKFYPSDLEEGELPFL